MAVFSVQKIILYFVFLPLFCFSQTSISVDLNWHKEIKLMSKYSTPSAKKYTRSFLRVLKSNSISSNQRKDIYNVLDNFKLRKLNFSSYYIPFFKLVLEMGNSVKSEELTDFLFFLNSSEKLYNDLDFKNFLNKVYLFKVDHVLNKSDYFIWTFDGEYDFFFNLNQEPVFHLLNTKLVLANTYDTIQFDNVSGTYNVLENKFYCSFADRTLVYDHFSTDFEFENFTLDLNKRFLKIDSVGLAINGSFRGECLGTYKDKLTSSDNYPIFSSYSKKLKFELFENMNLISGFQIKGNKSFFKNRAGVRLFFVNDSVDFLFVSSEFQLVNQKLYGSSVDFLVNKTYNILEHPLVSMVYDNENKKIHLHRVKEKRGLNPIRNSFHGLNMFVDRIEIDLFNNQGLFFHNSFGRDFSVLFESNTYFDINKYNDLISYDLNPLTLLLSFLKDKNIEDKYFIHQLVQFSKFSTADVLNIILDLEIFGFLNYNEFEKSFKIKSWAFNFFNSVNGDYDYDSFKLQTTSKITDTVAKIDFSSYEMEVFGVEKLNFTKRFDFNLFPEMDVVKFVSDKSFLFDGDIYIGNLAFSGKNILFDYNSFSFSFTENSILSFLHPQRDKLSQSIIHFDNGVLLLDSINNKSGSHQLDDFPRFKVLESAYLSYINNNVNFIIKPFELNYLNDLALKNVKFDGHLYLDSVVTDLEGVLSFDNLLNLKTTIKTDTPTYLYKNHILFDGVLNLTSDGLFGSGILESENLLFKSEKVLLSSGNIKGFVDTLTTNDKFNTTPFSLSEGFVNYFPYKDKFLIKSLDKKINIHSDLDFVGDLYYDSENLNGSGTLSGVNFLIKSAHHFFSSEGFMAADAVLDLFDSNEEENIIFNSLAVSVEKTLFSDTMYIFKNNDDFFLPNLDYTLDFDFVLFDTFSNSLIFKKNIMTEAGILKTKKYGKSGFEYQALEVVYSISSNDLCVKSVFPLSLKNFWLQPEDNQFCISKDGLFPTFSTSTLIKKRWLLKDKLYNNVNVRIKPSLKLLFIKN